MAVMLTHPQSSDHAYTVGIEEEFFVSHARSFAPARHIPRELVRAFLKLKYGNVAPEMLQTQIEVNSGVCGTFGQARERLARLRQLLHQTAREYDYVISASGTHPMAIWHEQMLTQKARYRRIQDDL
jgi:carboxylate-amine ligase